MGNVVLGIFACFCSSTNWLSWQGGVLGNAARAREEERTRSLKRLQCCLWAVYVSCKQKMTSNYCSAVWTVIKLGGFKNPGTCERPHLPEVCPRPVRCRERSSRRRDAEITAEIPVTAWVFENVGENITLNELQRSFRNPSRTGTCTYVYFCCSEFLPITWPLMPAA